ncbi:MAG: tRNA lysidine(34) synthetase TilS [Anaerolineales bacterium]|nr:tRNA lysidine(34) synthetase TilS [Anaerolineales bacterium]
MIVAVSGGPDSLCLLDILHKFSSLLMVAHFNHGLRPESESDARAVRREAEKRSLTFILGEDDVATFAADNRLSIEEAARIRRYRFLFAQAEKYDIQAVAVGHTADDQIETMLMHLLRGAGLSGLKGMPARSSPNAWSAGIPLLRPLISIWREEVLAYCREYDLKPVIDRSNMDTTIYRNRLRRELIPYLESYNPGVKQVLYRTSRILAGEFDILIKVVDEAWELVFREQDLDYVALDPAMLKKQPVGVQRQLLRCAIAVLRPDLRDIDFDSIERGLAFLIQPSKTNSIDLIAGLRLMFEGDILYLATWEADLPSSKWPQMTDRDAHRLVVPGEIQLTEGWRISASGIKAVENLYSHVLANEDPNQAWIERNSIKDPLIVRKRQPGDRFRPLGMGSHSIKLSEFMINVKMPRRARDAWPLVCSGDDIVWVPGYRLGHQFQVSPATIEAIYMRLDRTQTPSLIVNSETMRSV